MLLDSVNRQVPLTLLVIIRSDISNSPARPAAPDSPAAPTEVSVRALVVLQQAIACYQSRSREAIMSALTVLLYGQVRTVHKRAFQPSG